ncbi:MAG: tetratricopeptide repeat protein [Flavobacteriales bacterium]|nr:tetratricopeptide repeat protein [Flavobacteriales bacterium]
MELFIQLEKNFKEIVKGKAEPTIGFYELLWVNYTGFARYGKTKDLLDEIFKWSEANRSKHPDFFAWITLTIGSVLFLTDDFEQSKKYLNDAAVLFKEMQDEESIAACNVVMGFLYRSTGETDLAMRYGLYALDMLENTDRYKVYLIMCYYWLGGVYMENGHYDNALKMFESALNLDYPLGIQHFSARLVNAIGGVYMKQGKHELALMNLNKALELSNSETESTFIARGLTDLGDYYLAMENYVKAIEYNKQALEIRVHSNIRNGSITNYINLGEIYLKKGEGEKALNVLLECLPIAEDIHVKPKLYQIHQKLSEVYMLLGNTGDSFKHFRIFHETFEAVNNDDIENKVKNQLALYKAEQTRKENIIIKAQKEEIEKEKQRSDDLLRNILPDEIAQELKTNGSAKARYYDEVTVLFTDFKDFTKISEKMTPDELVKEIDECFKGFDEIVEQFDLEKIKTIGDSYMCVSGLPITNPEHALKAVHCALKIRDFMDKRSGSDSRSGKPVFNIRIGLHSGPVVAGVVGFKKFAFDIWGDTVNTASRMESSGEAGKVNISNATYELIKHHFNCIQRGRIEAKSKGLVEMYFVEEEI